ncbi:MAG: MoxR family ATPase [Acutalibacter sp.]|nr:MoxR family ATPase [Acutalibacter sp.]
MNPDNIKALKENIALRIVGKDDLIENVITALLAGGHILLEDVPGVGKTTLAKALAASLNCSFARIQFTPDTLPGDVVGMSIYNAKTGEFEIVKGAVAHQIILADEINRSSPKTQSSLLEAMEEHQITIDNHTFPLPEPFMVIATENPIDSIGTYALPESELDRFMMKLSVGYPSEKGTLEMADRFLSGQLQEEIHPVLTAEEVIEMQKEAAAVSVHEELIKYIAEIISETRRGDEVRYGASPRATLVLIRASQARAYVRGRDYVIPEDIRDMAQAVLSHRLVLTAEAKMARQTGSDVVRHILNRVKVPGIR